MALCQLMADTGFDLSSISVKGLWRLRLALLHAMVSAFDFFLCHVCQSMADADFDLSSVSVKGLWRLRLALLHAMSLHGLEDLHAKYCTPHLLKCCS